MHTKFNQTIAEKTTKIEELEEKLSNLNDECTVSQSELIVTRTQMECLEKDLASTNEELERSKNR